MPSSLLSWPVAGIGFEQAGIELQCLSACDQRRVGICIGKVGIDYFECTSITGHLLRFECWRGHNLKVETSPRLQHFPLVILVFYNARAADRVAFVDGNRDVCREVAAIAVDRESCYVIAQLHPVFFHRTHPNVKAVEVAGIVEGDAANALFLWHGKAKRCSLTDVGVI